jgi:hypothetical protein
LGKKNIAESREVSYMVKVESGWSWGDKIVALIVIIGGLLAALGVWE